MATRAKQAAVPADKADKLGSYRAKRDFARTPEPAPEPPPGQEALAGSRFVMQRHGARRLHYDLRLELDGVLLSWAVPNGPSYVTTEKRLAVRTEDHPLKYLEFEGTIPKGEYGGGTMIVWDRGTWKPVHNVQKSLAKGHLEFELDGERLKGRWHLVRLRRPREKGEPWLMIKADDAYARQPADRDVLEEHTTSVLSGRSNDELGAADLRGDHRARQAVAAARGKKLPDGAVKGARKGFLSVFVEPALATAAEQPPKGTGWWHEVKFDGYRMQARVDGPEVRLLTRTGLDWTQRFKPIAEAVAALGLDSAVLDGEVVVEDAAGISSFSELVNDLKAGRAERFRYYAFDLMYLSGHDLRDAPLAERKRLLAEVMERAPNPGRVTLSEHFDMDGAAFFEHVSRLGLEGMVSKRPDGRYRSGRSKDWIKCRCILSQEFVVVGYVSSTTSRRIVGSLALGYYEGTDLLLAGRVGSGFTGDTAKALYDALQPLRIAKPVFGRKPPPEAEKGVQWVEPRLVVQADFHAWPADGLIRHSTFQGVREDRDPTQIVREHAGQGAEPQTVKAAKSAAPKIIPVFTHADRVLWPDDGITKQGLAEYYINNTGRILPFVTGRPLSLVRCPNGIVDCFYAKHAWAGLDASVRRIDAGKDEQSLVIDGLEGLLSLVQSNVLEIHPWGSREGDVERPDMLIFDLDPGDGVTWSRVIEAAREVRERLKAKLKLESFVKTSGGKGLHVVVPLVPAVEWDPAKAICKELAEDMEADDPRRYIANMSKQKRAGRVFIDYLRNGRGATAVAAYSTRARPGAAVSTPLAWEELSEAIKADHFRLGNIDRRLAYLKDDPWAGYFDVDQALPGAAKKNAAKTVKPRR